MKYIFVSGGVISGIGKGLTSASVGLLLQNAGYTVTPIKCENYLNIDAELHQAALCVGADEWPRGARGWPRAGA